MVSGNKGQKGNLGKERVAGGGDSTVILCKGILPKKKKKMFPGYSKVRRREHFEDIGGKAITGRSKSIGLAKAGQTEQLGEGGNQ